jgi:hypothetical protein
MRPQFVAPGLRYLGAVIKPRMQICGKRGFRAVTADGAPQCVQRDDVAGAFPDRAEMGVTQQPRGRELLDIAGAAAHLERVAADFPRIARRAEFQGRRQDAQQRRRILAAGLGTVERICGEEAHR